MLLNTVAFCCTLLQVLALVSAALIEMARYRVVRESGVLERFVAAGPEADPLDPLFTQPMRCEECFLKCLMM
jgi:hypothetical protein